MSLLEKSDADYLLLAGDLNVDPRDGEGTYKTFKGALTDSIEEFYKDDKSKWLDPHLSTLGNPANTYTSKSSHPVIYDYVWYRPGAAKTISVASYQVIIAIIEKERGCYSFHCRCLILPLVEKRM